MKETQEILIAMGFKNLNANVWESEWFGVFVLLKDATPEQLAIFIYNRKHPQPQEVDLTKKYNVSDEYKDIFQKSDELVELKKQNKELVDALNDLVYNSHYANIEYAALVLKKYKQSYEDKALKEKGEQTDV